MIRPDCAVKTRPRAHQCAPMQLLAGSCKPEQRRARCQHSSACFAACARCWQHRLHAARQRRVHCFPCALPTRNNPLSVASHTRRRAANGPSARGAPPRTAARRAAPHATRAARSLANPPSGWPGLQRGHRSSPLARRMPTANVEVLPLIIVAILLPPLAVALGARLAGRPPPRGPPHPPSHTPQRTAATPSC